MSTSKKKRLADKHTPAFRNEDDERAFWAEHDAADHFDWDRAVEPTFSALKPSTTTISLRLPQALLDEIKILANERDVPYQSLLKIFLAERVARERQRRQTPGET